MRGSGRDYVPSRWVGYPHVTRIDGMAGKTVWVSLSTISRPRHIFGIGVGILRGGLAGLGNECGYLMSFMALLLHTSFAYIVH